MTTLSIVTTCKGRLHHLRQTLPAMLAAGADEVIVVDYSCPDGAGDWVEREHPRARVVRVPGQEGFNVSLARNAGARSAVGEQLAMVDADVRLASGFGAWARAHATPGAFFHASAGQWPGDPVWQLYGTALVPRRAFVRLGGYDEMYWGWGGEDGDLYAFLRRLGLEERELPPGLAVPIDHGEEERLRFYGLKDRRTQIAVNSAYLTLKEILTAAADRPLPEDTRRRLMLYAQEAATAALAGGAPASYATRLVRRVRDTFGIVCDLRFTLVPGDPAAMPTSATGVPARPLSRPPAGG